MSSSKIKRVCLTPRVSGVGGMVTFQAKFALGLARRGIGVTFDIDDDPCDSVLVIGGTRHLADLRRARQRGIPVVQRLDGMNWLHRRTRTGALHWLRAERGNRVLAGIRSNIATRVVYQSNFVQKWWQREFGNGPEYSVIYNGVDLDVFNPHGPERAPVDRIRILMVEGNFTGGYELGLRSAIDLSESLEKITGQKVELVVAGNVDEKQTAKWSQSEVQIDWAGVVPNEQIPSLNRSAHLIYSSDLNAACPNSVIEALACGLPVLAFDTGALSELVTAQAGRVVPYRGDPWKLDPPDISSLAVAAGEIIENQAGFRAGARGRAEQAFGLDKMVDSYLEALSG